MSLKKARLKDIADLAGVSIGTVDRVLHNRGEVAEKTKIKVQQILADTKYSPNVMAQALKTKKSFHLVSLLPTATKDNTFWEKHELGMRRAIEELEPFQVSLSQVTFDIQSEDDFQNKTQIVLDQNPDGVLLSPIFNLQSVSFCSELKNQRIPFVFIDGYIEKTEFLAYIGEDIFQSGRVAGQLVDLVTPVDGDILIVTIARNARNVNHLTKRTEGFLSYFNKSLPNKGRKIILNVPVPSPELLTHSFDKAFTENPGIKSIFITGSRSYLIVRYLRRRKLKTIELIGYDLLEENVKCLKEGYIRFLIGQRPDEQSYKGIKKLFEYLSLRKTPEKIEYLPVDIVTSENVDFFL